MFVENLKNDFYNVIQGKSCLVLANFDVDAICACKILQFLFKNDNMVYTLVPVQGQETMLRAYQENAKETKYVIMVNCGGNVDIVELLQPSEETVFFIIDSHRPYDLPNIYSENQVRILHKPDDDDDIPEYHEIYKDETSDEEEVTDASDDEGESRMSKRRRLNEEDILKRRERRQWEEHRDAIIFNYTQYSYYGKSSAVMMFEMAWKMSKDSLDMAWWAIIGATEQAMLNKIEMRVSILEAGSLQSHVSRLNHKQGIDLETQQQSAVKVTYDRDLQLALYRHWTVEASLKHSTPTAVALRLWSHRGEKRLRELLAEMGLPLVQSRQRFSSMDLNLRKEFRQMVERIAGKYNVDSVVGASFTLQYGYRFKYCASDIVYAMLALLEPSTRENQPQHCFLDALDCLSRMKKEVLERGIEKAKLMLCNIYKTAQSILEMKQVMNMGSLLYVIMPEGTPDSRLFAHPHALMMLAQFMLRAYVKVSRNRRANTWALVASAIFDPEEGTSLIVGVPPICEDPPRSLFGQAFLKTAESARCHIETDYFDTTFIRLKTEERGKFFDSLANLLSNA